MNNSSSLTLFIILLITYTLFVFQTSLFLVLSASFFLMANSGAVIKFSIKKNLIPIITFLIILILLSSADLDKGFTPIFYLFVSGICLLSAQYTAKAYTFEQIYNSIFLLYIFTTCILFYYLYKFWGQPEPFGNIIKGSSTNGFPSYLIILQSSISVLSYLMKRKVGLITPFITTLIAFFGSGRGSLVVSMLIVIFSFYINIFLYKGAGKRANRIIPIVFSVIMLFLLSYLTYQYGSILVEYTKLSVGLGDENRIEIFNEYINNLDSYTLMFGGNYKGTVIDELYDGNPHISFVRTHYLFGLIPMLIYFFSPLYVLFIKNALSVKIVLLGFLTICWLRSLSEPILFPTILDYFYFLIFFLAGKNLSENNKHYP